MDSGWPVAKLRLLLPVMMFLGCSGAQSQRDALAEIAPCWDPQESRGIDVPVARSLLDPLARRDYVQESAIHLETFCQLDRHGQVRSAEERDECERYRCALIPRSDGMWLRSDSSPWMGSAREIDDCRSATTKMLMSYHSALGADFSEPVLVGHDGELSAFRLFMMPTQGIARAMIRVVRVGDRVFVVSKRLEKSEERGQGRLGWIKQRVVGVSEWTRLQELVARSRFWALPTVQPPEEEVLRDGTVYNLEGVEAGVQHVVSVRWPDAEFVALVEYLSLLGGCNAM